jgi:RNA polymerase sigma factor (sigma-70 family)
VSQVGVVRRRGTERRAPDRDDDRAALELLYSQERAALLRVAVLLTGSRTDAEDVVQDAFEALGRRRAPLADPARAAGYLRVSVVNGARTLQRRRRVAWRHQPRLLERDAGGADEGAMLAAEHAEVAKLVTALPKRQQQVVVLRYWTGMSDDQIAEALGISPGTVRATVSRSMKTIAADLGGQR